jgi:hypothetical protein
MTAKIAVESPWRLRGVPIPKSARISPRSVPSVDRVETSLVSGSRQAHLSGLWWEKMSSLPLQFLLLTVAGWMTRDQRLVTEYLLAENKVLRQQLRGRRVRYTDAQRRRRLALAAMRVGRKALSRIDTLVTPDTLLR